MRFVEGKWNAGLISSSLQNSEAITTTQTNRRIEEDRDGTQQMVSSVIVNERRPSIVRFESSSHQNVDISQLDERWQGEYVDSLLENIDVSQLDDRWQGTERVVRYRNGMLQGYFTRFILPEDVILIRFIEEEYPRVGNTINLYYVQIIWNSFYSWRQIMQHVQDSTGQFNFIDESMRVSHYRINIRVEEMIRRRIVDALPDVVIRREDDGVECTVCYETFKNEETAKQLECNHLFHSNCILQWFTRRINCPKCRTELN